MNTPEQIISYEQDRGAPRSAIYWRGALDVLRFRMEGARVQCPFREGTVEFDAYFSGNERGLSIWRRTQEIGATSAHPIRQKDVHRAHPLVHGKNG